MARRVATHFPQRINLRVPNMAYTGSMEGADLITAVITASLTVDATAFLSAQSTAAAGTATTFNNYLGTEAQMAKFGRSWQVVASGAATGTVTASGRDYLGQRVTETLTLNGTTPVIGKKAIRYMDSISWTISASVTVNVGTANIFGLQYKLKSLVTEIKNGAPAANAGTVVSGLTTGTASTATTADVRGTYAPSTLLPDGTNVFELRYVADNSNLHGNAQA